MMQPGYCWSDHHAYHDGNQLDENNLIKEIEKPKLQDNRNENESRLYDLLECPSLRLRWWIKRHGYLLIAMLRSARLLGWHHSEVVIRRRINCQDMSISTNPRAIRAANSPQFGSAPRKAIFRNRRVP